MTASSPSRPAPLAARLLSLGLEWLYIVHRWLGVATCILCAVWFVSGVVMVYVPYPGLTDRDRMTYSEPIAWDKVAVSPDKALAAAGAKRFPSQFKLTMLRDTPVYRLVADGERATVSAVDGHRIEGASAADAAEIVQRLRPHDRLGPVKTLFHDQWTVAQGFDPHRPLYRVPVRGSGGLTLYVSSRTGEVVNDTTGWERAWNWLGSIPHWLYLTVIRQDNAFWRQLIMWTSGPAIIGAATGIWLGLLRMRVGREVPLGDISPYRGWMSWHHVSGLIAGLFVLGWLVSGWLSVNPFHWFHREAASQEELARYAGQDAPRFDANLAALRALPYRTAREARLIWVGGRPLVVLMGPSLLETTLDARTGAPAGLTDADLFAEAGRLSAGAPVAFARRLTQDDDYWYSTPRSPRRMPVLRVGFADPERTWVHIDPATGEILGRTDNSGRAYRWWFNAPHAFDLPVLLRHGPSREILIGALSIGGLIVSVSGVVIGWRRVVVKFVRRPKRRRASRLRQSRPTRG
ncbi:MAG TPA: PepSY domain-containing protein [Caulobacteraceae bacterium]|jgi:uncharacterized iron-regulated membrane protein|nr:PepSY domain-containing protein [Caulobacteraceae bacterium]